MQHVIVGAGRSGVIAAESIRQYDSSSTVTLIADEGVRPYSRAEIPDFLSGRLASDAERSHCRPEHFAARGIELRRARVVSLDADRDEVVLENGERLEFDRLLLATGSTPVPLDTASTDSPDAMQCWTLDDAARLADRSLGNRSVLIVGAGYRGCSLLNALWRRGASITLVDMNHRIMARRLGEIPSNMLALWCEAQGVRIVTGSRVTALEESAASPADLGVQLHDGRILQTDLLLWATTVRPELSYLKGSGVKRDRGILVDRYFHTSRSRVYAAGDACQGLNFGGGEYGMWPLQSSFVEPGRIAAANMTGTPARCPEVVPVFKLDILGLKAASLGSRQGEVGGETAEVYDRENFRYLSITFQEDVLVGVTHIGCAEHLDLLEALIRCRTRLGSWKQRLMQDPLSIVNACDSASQRLPK